MRQLTGLCVLLFLLTSLGFSGRATPTTTCFDISKRTKVEYFDGYVRAITYLGPKPACKSDGTVRILAINKDGSTKILDAHNMPGFTGIFRGSTPISIQDLKVGDRIKHLGIWVYTARLDGHQGFIGCMQVR